METVRQSMDVDIVCVGFGPAMGGFLTTLSKSLTDPDLQNVLESRVMPGLPLQVVCYERADDIGFGVSGVVTRARAIKQSFPDLDPKSIPMAYPVKREKLVYLLDPVGASRRSGLLRFADKILRSLRKILPIYKEEAIEIPFIPSFMNKHDGMILSIGQFNSWVGSQIMGSGAVQIWPAMPVREPLFEENRVAGIRLQDQGVDKSGKPAEHFSPGMDVKAALTVVGDGPFGAMGQQLDLKLGLPEGHHQYDWAVGMKVVVELPEGVYLEPGTVFHTLGFPEPEIFGFMYVYPDRMASLGIFIPSWLDSPVRTSYRYLQHWMQHPYLWRYLKDATIKSWGAKSIQESGRRGEPYLTGDGFARIGEGSGSTNVLTNSGVDEAWATGIQLAEAVIQLYKEKKPFTQENLEATYVARRRASWVEKEGRIAEKARDGFQKSFVRGMMGMSLSGFTNGRINLSGGLKRPHERVESLEKYYAGKIPAAELQKMRDDAVRTGTSLHDAVMDRLGWPKIEYDGKLLISHQDALLLGGKVQAPEGYADHVVFLHSQVCENCGEKVCIELCSAQAITMNSGGGVPLFDREKCVHCGACLWNCAHARLENPERGNVDFRAGAGGLHSVEN